MAATSTSTTRESSHARQKLPTPVFLGWRILGHAKFFTHKISVQHSYTFIVDHQNNPCERCYQAQKCCNSAVPKLFSKPLGQKLYGVYTTLQPSATPWILYPRIWKKQSENWWGKIHVDSIFCLNKTFHFGNSLAWLKMTQVAKANQLTWGPFVCSATSSDLYWMKGEGKRDNKIQKSVCHITC